MCQCEAKSEKSADDDADMSNNNNVDCKVYHPLKEKRKGKVEEVTSGLLAQCLITSAVMISSASCGMPVGYSAILLPQLKAENSQIQIDDESGSWIASIHSAATPIGSLLSGLLMDCYGRKTTLQIAGLPLIVGWFLIAFSQNYVTLMIGRFVAGLSTGLTASTGQVLVGEITQPQLRGILSSMPFASYSFGILMVYILGYLFHWRHVAIISSVTPIIAILLYFMLPESPVWLLRHNKIEDAKKALKWLRGNNHDLVQHELDQIVDRMELENKNLKSNEKSSWATLLEPAVLKPFIIMNIFNLLQILSGTYLVVFYAVDILSQIKGTTTNHFLAAVWTATARFIFNIIAILLLGFVGRRSLSIFSGIGTGITALGFAFIEYYSCQPSGQLAAICILLYVATNSVGFMILPGILLGELYPAKIRGFAGGITFMIFHFAMFSIAKVFPVVQQVIGVHSIFCIFGVTSLIASIFLYLILPETKGKSLSQIEDYFQQKNIFWMNRRKGYYQED